MQGLNLILRAEKIYWGWLYLSYFCKLKGCFSFQPTNPSPRSRPTHTHTHTKLVLYKPYVSGSQSGKHKAKEKTSKKVRARWQAMGGEWLENLAALVSWNSRRKGELEISLAKSLNIKWEVQSQETGLDLLISGIFTYQKST